MKFHIHAANPKTGEEFDWDVDAQSIQEAERQAQDAGMLVSSVVPLSVEAKSARSSRQSETTGGAGISRTTRTPPEDPDRVLLSATPAVVPKVMPLIVVAALLLVGGFAAPFLLVGTVVCVVGIVFLALTQRFTVLTITSERTTLTTGILGRSTSEV